MVRISFVILIISIFSILSCDFFMASTFPDYLPSVRRVESLDKYFSSSNKYDYDMFVIDNDSGNDFVFVLFRPESGNRKVIVLDSDLNIKGEYENIDMGSLHYKHMGGTRAVVGTWSMLFAGFAWDTDCSVNIGIANKDNILALNTDSNVFYMLFTTSNGESIQSNAHNNDATVTINISGTDIFQISNTSEEFVLENATFNDNDNGDTIDDCVILYLRRRENNEGIALMIPIFNTFPDTVVSPALDNYPVFYFGPIKPGSVHVKNDGMCVILERHDGTVVNYSYNGSGFNWSGETNGLQFRNRIVAYSPYKPEYYVFDPGTKDIFKCTVWWKMH